MAREESLTMTNKIITIIGLIFLVSIMGVSASVYDDGLVSYYKFDNNDFSDELGNYDGTNGGTTNTSGILIDSRDYANQYVSLASDTFSELTNNHTFNFWVYRDSNSGEQHVMSKRPGTYDSILNAWVVENFYTYFQSNDDGSKQCNIASQSFATGTGGWDMVTIIRNVTHVSIKMNTILGFTQACQTQENFAIDSEVGSVFFGKKGNDASGYFNGRIDEVAIFSRPLSDLEIVELYNNGSGLPYDTDVDYNSSVLSDGIEIDDFTFATSTMSLIDSIQFNTSSNYNIYFPITFNTEKLTGALSNDIKMRIDIDNVTVYNTTVRTVSSKNSIGSTGALVLTNLTTGEHDLDIYFSRTGNGEISVSNYNLNFGTPVTSDSTNVSSTGIQDESFSLNLTGGITQSFKNITFVTDNDGKSFFIGDVKLSGGSSTDIRMYLNNTDTGVSSKIINRGLSSGTTGAISLNAIIENNVNGSNNYSLMVYSVDTTTLDISLSYGLVNLKDSVGNIVQGYSDSGIGNITTPNNHSAGTETVLSDTFTWNEGDSIFYTYTSSAKSLGASRVNYTINVSNSTSVVCSDLIQRDYTTQTGNQYIHGFCNSLIPGIAYNITVYGAYSGSDISHYDDSLSYLESTSLGVSEFVDIIDPVVNLTIPGNTSLYFDGVISGLCQDTYAISSVSVNDSRFVFNTSSDVDNWTFNFNESGEFDIGVNISCTDINGNTGTAVYNLLIDTVDPSITINSPTDLERYNESVYLDISYYDERLYNATTIVYYPNGSILYSDNVEDINTTAYNVTYNFTSLSVYGIYNVSAKACDSHTNNKPKFEDWGISKNDLGIDFGNCDVSFDGNSNKINDISYICEGDRCSWDFEFNNNEHDPSFLITCDQPIKEIVGSEYLGHLVSGVNWIDAENDMGFDVNTFRISDYQYRYTFLGSTKNVVGRSIGELNCNTRDIQFEYVNGSLYEVGTPYTPPEVFQGSLIGNIPESIEEVLMLFFILALCVVVTVFAVTDKARGWWFLCSLTWLVFGLVITPYSFPFGLIFLLGSIGLMFSKLF